MKRKSILFFYCAVSLLLIFIFIYPFIHSEESFCPGIGYDFKEKFLKSDSFLKNDMYLMSIDEVGIDFMFFYDRGLSLNGNDAGSISHDEIIFIRDRYLIPYVKDFRKAYMNPVELIETVDKNILFEDNSFSFNYLGILFSGIKNETGYYVESRYEYEIDKRYIVRTSDKIEYSGVDIYDLIRESIGRYEFILCSAIKSIDRMNISERKEK